MVWILPQDHHLDLFKRTGIKSPEYFATGRIYGLRLVFLTHEINQARKIVLPELAREPALPGSVHLDIGDHKGQKLNVVK